MSTKCQVSSLRLVYPPISNQEAYWLERDPEVEAQLRESDFYMIVGRAEAKFAVTEADKVSGVVRFDLTIQGGVTDSGSLRLYDVPDASTAPQLMLEGGEKIFKIWDRPREEPGAQLLEWFTTEKLLYDRAHGHPALDGLDRYRELASYDLFYVGIAKKGDSYDRLIKSGHKRRQDILTNEPQRHPHSRVSDETYLLLFKVETLGIQMFEPGDDFEDLGVDFTSDKKRIVADAEKAFIRLLDPHYNERKYANYPKGSDGLYGSGLVRYGYVIDEGLVLNTGRASIRGAHDPIFGMSNDSDAIFIEGDDVALYLAGAY